MLLVLSDILEPTDTSCFLNQNYLQLRPPQKSCKKKKRKTKYHHNRVQLNNLIPIPIKSYFSQSLTNTLNLPSFGSMAPTVSGLAGMDGSYKC